MKKKETLYEELKEDNEAARQLVRCYGGIFCCKRLQKLDYKGLELRMEKN